MIKTHADLMAWIEGHAERHAERGEGCSCGWNPPAKTIPGYPPITWAEHESAMLIVDLGDVLPSNTLGEDGPVAWAPLVNDLYRSIDIRDANCTCDFDWPDE